MRMKDVKEVEMTELHITHGMLPVREKQSLKTLLRCRVAWRMKERSFYQEIESRPQGQSGEGNRFI